MVRDNHNPPVQYHGVMVSSTFKDLKNHRDALMNTINGQEFKFVGMENDAAKPGVNVIESSLEMVEKSSAYIGIIARKYGQIIRSTRHNPKNLSLTELEFNKAQQLRRPILLFIMGDKHPVKGADTETDRTKRKKLSAFRERAKQMDGRSKIPRVYATFDSLDEFGRKASQSVAALGRYLDKEATRAQSNLLIELTKCRSQEALTVIRWREGSSIPDHVVIAANSRAETLFGYTEGSFPPGGVSLGELFDRIEDWMGHHSNKFMQDQRRMEAGLKKSEEIFAAVPIVFGPKHPNDAIRYRVFLPIAVCSSNEYRIRGKRTRDTLIACIDVERMGKEMGFGSRHASQRRKRSGRKWGNRED